MAVNGYVDYHPDNQGVWLAVSKDTEDGVKYKSFQLRNDLTSPVARMQLEAALQALLKFALEPDGQNPPA